VRTEKEIFLRELSKLMIPIAFQSFMLAAVAASDSIMLGIVSQDALSAVSLASKIQFVQNIGIAGLVGGGMVLSSQYLGKSDKVTVGNIFTIMLRYAMLICILFWAISFFIPTTLMKVFTNDITMIEIGAKYLKISSWSYLIIGITQCYLMMLKTSNKALSSAVVSSIAVVVNIILNAVFIFGLFNIPKMSAEGAALATVLARIIELILALIIFKKSKCLDYSLINVIKLDSNLEKEFWKVSKNLIFNEIIWGAGITIYSIVIGHLGNDATAANSIASVVKDLVTSLCRGIGVGGGIMIGYRLGCNDFDNAKVYGDRLVKISFIYGLVCAAIILVSIPLVLNTMVLTDVAMDYLLIMLIICSVYMIAKSLNIAIINGIFHAGGDSKFDAYSLGVTMWGIIIPLALLGTFLLSWPVLLIYLIISLDEIIKVPWVLHHYRKYKWLKNITK
jgi:putative MATE family efflux protein